MKQLKLLLLLIMISGNSLYSQKVSKTETINFLKLKFHSSSLDKGEIFFLQSGIIRIKFSSEVFSFSKNYFIPVVTILEFNITDVSFKKEDQTGDFGYLGNNSNITTFHNFVIICKTGNCIKIKTYPEFDSSNKEPELNKSYSTSKYHLAIDSGENASRLVKAFKNLQSYYPKKELKEIFDK